ncbi:hypothetical protein, partial [Clostridium perfringens]
MRASAPGLKPARVRVDRLAIPPLVEAPAVASATRIERWRMSPLLSSRPDPALAPADGDNNSWAFVRSGAATPAEASAGWRVYR